MESGTDDRINRMRDEVTRRREELKTSKQRKEAAVEMAREFRVHQDFILGFIEDVIGVARQPTAADIERAERITHREIPQSDD